MPKRQKEKQYQSAREHRANQSLRSSSTSLSSTVGSSASTRPLPFDCCALTLTPYTTPVCTSDGILFENSAITPHLIKHKIDPVTGKPMTTSDLIVLNMEKDDSTGQWMCPVLNKPFTNRTKVVAILQNKNEANVYSYEAYYELNIKAKNYLDLVSGHKFNKETDVITLQDIENAEHCQLRDIQNFSHIREMREENVRQQQYNQQSGDNVRYSVTATRIMEKLEKEKRKRERVAEDEAKKLMKSTLESNDDDDNNNNNPDKEKTINIYTDELLTSIHQTSGKASGSLTSTTMDITRENSARLATQDEIINSQCEQLRNLKKKGMIRMFTNKGAMDIELHCDIVPRTTMNFILLAKQGEYDGSQFHRSIPNFMIQGGKKPGMKKGSASNGSSIWDKQFPDEFDDRLTHTGSGIVSMANSGPGTNGRQFFITYKSCAHLNRKHTVFGKVVGGIEVLRRLEQVPTDDETDRPLENLKIESIDIIDNPVEEALEIERVRIEKRKNEKKLSKESRVSSTLSGNTKISDTLLPSSMSKAIEEDGSSTDNIPPIGRYLKNGKDKSTKQTTQVQKPSKDGVGGLGTTVGLSRLPPPPQKTTFGNFSGW
jgi:peptidyl-prolyl cis-trans isomerase-like protein 2